MNTIKNLSNDIQELIYNQYLEKQRDYYVYQYNNRIKLLYFDKLKQNIEHINSFIVDDYFDKLKTFIDIDREDEDILNKWEDNFNDKTYKYFVETYFRLCKYV